MNYYCFMIEVYAPYTPLYANENETEFSPCSKRLRLIIADEKQPTLANILASFRRNYIHYAKHDIGAVYLVEFPDNQSATEILIHNYR